MYVELNLPPIVEPLNVPLKNVIAGLEIGHLRLLSASRFVEVCVFLFQIDQLLVPLDKLRTSDSLSFLEKLRGGHLCEFAHPLLREEGADTTRSAQAQE